MTAKPRKTKFDPNTPAAPPDMTLPKFDYSPALLEATSTCDTALGFLWGAEIEESWLKDIQEEAQVLEAHHSTAIEGTQLTLDQAQRLLRGEQLPEVPTDVRRELLNYWDALERVSDYCADIKGISEQVILQIHKDIVQGVRGEAAKPGHYRLIQNAIVNNQTGNVIFTPQPPETVSASMAELVAWTNTQLGDEAPPLHPILVAGISQFWFLHIHPFEDGNGRSARLLSTCILQAAGNRFVRLFALSAYYDKDRTAYYQALQQVRENNLNLTGWLEYFAEGLAEQLSELAKRARAERQLQQYALEHGLNSRQVEIIRWARRNAQISITDLEGWFPKVSRRTLQRDLLRLEQLNLVKSRGATNQQFWEVMAVIGIFAVLGRLFGSDDKDDLLRF